MLRFFTSWRPSRAAFTHHPLRVLWALSLALSLALWQALQPHGATAVSAELVAVATQSPDTLSDADIALYKQAYDAQKRGDFDTADASMQTVSNKRLLGHLLADRYLNSGYQTSADELRSWLAHYSDHPEAARISKLAIARGLDVAVIPAEAPLKGDGYAEHLGRSTMPDGWYRALSLWREQNYSEALPLFTAIGKNDGLSDWQRSAGYYWAYRAATKLSERDAADQNLAEAASFQTTFYGLLAAQQLGVFSIAAKAPEVSGSLRDNPQAVRAALLMQIGRSDDAEEQLRHLYSSVSGRDRAGIITLAHELNLPNLQVRLAGLQHLSSEEALFASYPMPSFMVDAQKDVSPALLLAIARNESGFRESSASHAGALGLMQMLPSTAQAIERRVGRELLTSASADNNAMPLVERLNDPAMSARYGAEYVKLLMQQPAIGRNLVRVLAAYNAGPGTVSAWQSAAQKIDDPLLYIESIPYPETHNYVLQVMAQYWVYQALMGEKLTSLDALAKGQWPQMMVGS